MAKEDIRKEIAYIGYIQADIENHFLAKKKHLMADLRVLELTKCNSSNAEINELIRDLERAIDKLGDTIKAKMKALEKQYDEAED